MLHVRPPKELTHSLINAHMDGYKHTQVCEDTYSSLRKQMRVKRIAGVWMERN